MKSIKSTYSFSYPNPKPFVDSGQIHSTNKIVGGGGGKTNTKTPILDF